MGVQISIQVLAFSYVGCIPRSGITVSYVSSIFNFLRNLHIVCHNSFTIYITTTVHKGSSFPTSSPMFVIFHFLMATFLMGVKWYLTVVLIFSLMSRDVEHLFMLFGHVYVVFGEMSIQSFAHF